MIWKRSISSMPEDLDISLTTNGIFLAERRSALADAGLDRVNISLDSLNPETYAAITGCKEGDLEKVLQESMLPWRRDCSLSS